MLKVNYIEPNKWYHRIYNQRTLSQLKKLEDLFTDDLTSPSEEEPLFITGFFRSGTSLITQLLHNLGLDLGPKEHLLQAKNSRASWNPDGFFENYLFMDVSLYAFTQLNAWGHQPPLGIDVANLNFTEKDRKKFAEFSICGVHDDRISNANKIAVLKNYDILSLDTYLKRNFKKPYGIKNPHFSVLTPFLNNRWPKAKYLVCFRHPLASLASAKKISPELDEHIYCKYYSSLLKMSPDKVCFVNYDDLIQQPIKILSLLKECLGLTNSNVEHAAKLIKPELNRFKSDKEVTNPELNDLYTELKKRCIG